MTLLLMALGLFAMLAPIGALAWASHRPRRGQAEPPPAIPRSVAYRTTILLGDCCLCIGKGQERRAA